MHRPIDNPPENDEPTCFLSVPGEARFGEVTLCTVDSNISSPSMLYGSVKVWES